MASITAVPEATPNPRVGITLAAWTDGAVAISRVHLDGTRVAVRGVPDASGGTTFVYDYESPLSEAFYYEAYSGATLITSASVTVATTLEAWLSVPGVPDQAIQVLVRAMPSVDYSRPTAVLSSPFRSSPAAEYGELGSAGFSFDVLSRSVAHRAALMAIIRQSGVLLWRFPRTEWTATYVMVTSAKPSPLLRIRRQGTDTTTPADWRWITLTCIETISPAGASYGDPTASYQALLDSGRTYQTTLDWKGAGATTYLDLLKGGF